MVGALGYRHLSRCGLRLLIGLLHAGLVFGGVDARQDLSGLDDIALAHLQALQLASHLGLDRSGIQRPYRAGHGDGLRQAQGARQHRIRPLQLKHRRLPQSDCGLLRLCLLGLSGFERTQHAEHQAENHHRQHQPFQPRLRRGTRRRRRSDR